MHPVLVVLDADPRSKQPALAKAVSLARALRCPLQVFVNCWDAATVRAAGLDEHRLHAAITSLMNGWERRLNQLLDELGAGDAELHLVFEQRSLPFLSNLILDTNPRLVVVHGQATSLLQRLTITPLHWTLLRKAPCPVLCVSDAAWPASPAVVAAIDVDEDDAPLNTAVLSQADALASALGGHTHAVHVAEFPDEALITLSESELVVTLPTPAQVIEKKSQALNALAEAQLAGTAETAVLEGVPAMQLAQYMEAHPGVLVLGSVYRGAIKRLLLGSTAERILQHSENDVLVVKAYDFETPWKRVEQA